MILGVIGMAVAAGNIWAFFIQWLSLLGVLVPPIGAIVLIDQYIVRPGAKMGSDYRPMAFVAWAAGSAVGLVMDNAMPQYSTAICSVVAGGIAYWVLSAVTKPATQMG